MEDDKHSSLHAEHLTLITDYITRQDSSQRLLYASVDEKKTRLGAALEANRFKLAGKLDAIQSTVDNEYEQLKEFVVRVIEEAKTRTKTRILNGLEFRNELIKETECKLMAIKSTQDVLARRSDAIRSIRADLDSCLQLDETAQVGVWNCVNALMNEAKTATMILSEVEEFENSFDSKNVELFEKIHVDYLQILKEDLGKIQTILSESTDQKRKSEFLALIKENIEQVLNSEIAMPLANPVVPVDRLGPLEEPVTRVQPAAIESLPKGKVLGYLSSLIQKHKLRVNQDGLQKASQLPVLLRILKEAIAQYAPPPPREIPVVQKPFNPPQKKPAKEPRKQETVSFKENVPVLETAFSPKPASKPVRASHKNLLKLLVEKPEKPTWNPDFFQPNSFFEKQNPETFVANPKTDEEKLANIDWILKKINKIKEKVPIVGSRSDEQDSEYSAGKDFNFGLSQLSKKEQSQDESKPKIQTEDSKEMKSILSNYLRTKILESHSYRETNPIMTGKNRLSTLLQPKAREDPQAESLGKRSLVVNRAIFQEEIAGPSKRVKDAASHKENDFGKPPQHRDKLFKEEEFLKPRLGAENQALQPLNGNSLLEKLGLKPVELNKELSRRILKYKLSRSFEGINHSSHTCKALSEGKSYYFTGCQPEDFIEVSLHEETFVSGMVLEPPMISSDPQKCASKTEGARVHIFRDGLWQDIGKVQFFGKDNTEFKVNRNTIAIRLAHGTNIDLNAGLGVGRLTLLS